MTDKAIKIVKVFQSTVPRVWNPNTSTDDVAVSVETDDGKLVLQFSIEAARALRAALPDPGPSLHGRPLQKL